MSFKSVLQRLFKPKKSRNKVDAKVDGDFIDLVQIAPEKYALMEQKISGRPLDEILEEIRGSFDILDLEVPADLNSRKILLIPPKFEFWPYFFLALRFVQNGYHVCFAYHYWSEDLLKEIKPNLGYLQYQSLKFHNVENLEELSTKDSIILNLSDSYQKADKIPGFSTAVVTKESDLDYAIGFILANTFNFGGIKFSNLKRIVLEEEIREEFIQKLMSRIEIMSKVNSTTIRSKRMKEELHELVSEAISDGADVLWGESSLSENKTTNLVLNHISKEMRIFQKKFFGPVLLLVATVFTTAELKALIQQQPSSGIIVFANSSKFVDMNAVAFKGKHVVLRPQWEVNDFLEANPNLEVLFEVLKYSNLNLSLG